MKKLLLLILLIVLITVLYLFTPARHYLSPEGFQELQIWIQSQGILAPLIFGIIYITATVLVLPGSVLTIGGGILFGTAWGTLINLISATLGATCAFLLARYLGREFVAKRLKGKVAQFDEKVGEHGFYTVLYLRLIPLFPFNLLNYSLGLTQVKFRDYFIASFVGMAPGSFVFTSLGGIGKHLRLSDPKTWADYHVWGPFALVILLSIIPRFFRKREVSPLSTKVPSPPL
jgi:uncharacterized membrane protein YdjX (TVP38/TMEM64 family)